MQILQQPQPRFINYFITQSIKLYIVLRTDSELPCRCRKGWQIKPVRKCTNKEKIDAEECPDQFNPQAEEEKETVGPETNDRRGRFLFSAISHENGVKSGEEADEGKTKR